MDREEIKQLARESAEKMVREIPRTNYNDHLAAYIIGYEAAMDQDRQYTEMIAKDLSSERIAKDEVIEQFEKELKEAHARIRELEHTETVLKGKLTLYRIAIVSIKEEVLKTVALFESEDKKEPRRQALIKMMQDDEELGLYDEENKEES